MNLMNLICIYKHTHLFQTGSSKGCLQLVYLSLPGLHPRARTLQERLAGLRHVAKGLGSLLPSLVSVFLVQQFYNNNNNNNNNGKKRKRKKTKVVKKN
jgi:hypothetical protein